MSYSARVSKPAVEAVLEKYLDHALARKIFCDIVDSDEEDHRNMIGMTYVEWKERFDDDRQLVWADDTPGFGKAGGSVYGNADNCIICCTRKDMHGYTLCLWEEVWASDKPFIRAAIKEYQKRKESRHDNA